MRRILICAALVLTGPASAAEVGAHQICKAKSNAAASIMIERQSGATMSDMVDRIHESGHAVRDKTKMVVAAFELPKEASSERKEEAAVRFENQIYLECMKLWAQ